VISNDKITTGNEPHSNEKTQRFNRTVSHCKTLFVSGLKNDVSNNHIRNHFIGCVKVTIKQNRATPHLK